LIGNTSVPWCGLRLFVTHNKNFQRQGSRSLHVQRKFLLSITNNRKNPRIIKFSSFCNNILYTSAFQLYHILYQSSFSKKAAHGGNFGKTVKDSGFSPSFSLFYRFQIDKLPGPEDRFRHGYSRSAEAAAAPAAVPLQGSARLLHGSSRRIAGYEISLLRAYYCYAFRYETAPEEAAT
jgi:hypothetical protein